MSTPRVKYIKKYFPIESYSYSSGTVTVNATNHGLFTGVPVSLTSDIHYSSYNGTANVTGANSFTVSSTINPQDLTHFSINGAISTGVTDAHTIPRGTGADTVVQSYVNGSNGAVYKIDLSLDGSHWINYTSVTHGSSDGNTMYNIISPGWAYLRANVTTIGANTNLVLMTSE